MIPRSFFWLFDLLVLCAAFLKAYTLSPFLYVWLSLVPAELRWLISESLALPDGTGSVVTLTLNAKGVLPPRRELLWILFSMVPATMLFVEMLVSLCDPSAAPGAGAPGGDELVCAICGFGTGLADPVCAQGAGRQPDVCLFFYDFEQREPGSLPAGFTLLLQPASGRRLL